MSAAAPAKVAPVGPNNTGNQNSPPNKPKPNPPQGNPVNTNPNRQPPVQPNEKLVVTNPSGMNIRSYPGTSTNSSIIGGAAAGQVVTVTPTASSSYGSGEDWRSDGRNWWVRISTTQNGAQVTGWMEYQDPTSTKPNVAPVNSTTGTRPGGSTGQQPWQNVAAYIKSAIQSPNFGNGSGSAGQYYNENTINQYLKQLSPSDLQSLFNDPNGLSQTNLTQWGLDLNGIGYGSFTSSMPGQNGTRASMANFLASHDLGGNGTAFANLTRAFSVGNGNMAVLLGKTVSALPKTQFGVQQRVSFVQGAGRVQPLGQRALPVAQALTDLIGNPNAIVSALKGYSPAQLKEVWNAPRNNPTLTNSLLKVFATDGNHLGSFTQDLVYAETTTGSNALNFSHILGGNLPPGNESQVSILQQAFLQKVTDPNALKNDAYDSLGNAPTNGGYGPAAVDLLNALPATASWALAKGGLAADHVNALASDVSQTSDANSSGLAGGPVWAADQPNSWNKFNGVIGKLNGTDLAAFLKNDQTAFQTLLTNGLNVGPKTSYSDQGRDFVTPLVNALFSTQNGTPVPKLATQDQHLAGSVFQQLAKSISVDDGFHFANINTDGQSSPFRDAMANLFSAYPEASVISMYGNGGANPNAPSNTSFTSLINFVQNEFVRGPQGKAQKLAGQQYAKLIGKLMMYGGGPFATNQNVNSTFGPYLGPGATELTVNDLGSYLGGMVGALDLGWVSIRQSLAGNAGINLENAITNGATDSIKQGITKSAKIDEAWKKWGYIRRNIINQYKPPTGPVISRAPLAIGTYLVVDVASTLVDYGIQAGIQAGKDQELQQNLKNMSNTLLNRIPTSTAGDIHDAIYGHLDNLNGHHGTGTFYNGFYQGYTGTYPAYYNKV